MAEPSQRARRLEFTSQPRHTWTTARCNRLLRPLSAKIAAFRKSLTVQQPLEPILNVALELASFRRSSNRPASEELDEDENWVAQPTKKRVRRRYGTRSRSEPTKSAETPCVARSVDIELPTPLLQRASTDQHEPVPTPINEDRWTTVTDGPKQQRMPRTISRIQSLCRVFETVLQITCDGARLDNSPVHRTPRRTGTSSLAKTCLHRMGEHIADEVQYRKMANPDDKADIVSETFDMLEGFDEMSGYCHSALREAVRSQAVQMMCGLVQDEAITSSMAFAILRTCTLHRAHDEAEKILCEFITSRPTLDHPLNAVDEFQHSEASFMGLLEQFGEVTGRQGFGFRMVRHLIASQKLPVTWLGTAAMRRVWNEAIRSIGSQDSQHHDALALLEAVFEAAAGVDPQDKAADDSKSRPCPSQMFLNDAFGWSSSTFEDGMEGLFSALVSMISSLCTLLCALAFLKIHAGDSIEKTYNSLLALRPLRAASIAIARSYSSSAFSHRATIVGTAMPASIIILGDLIVAHSESSDLPTHRLLERAESLTHTMKLAINGISYEAEIRELLCGVLISTADCCGRASDLIEDDALTFFTDQMRLAEHLMGATSMDRDSIRAIRAMAVKKFWGIQGMTSDATSSPSKQMHKVKAGPSMVGRLVGRTSKQSLPSPVVRPGKGFCWEEGLSEWIATTPGIRPTTAAMRLESTPLKRPRYSTRPFVKASSASESDTDSVGSSDVDTDDDAVDNADTTPLTVPSSASGSLRKRLTVRSDMGESEDEDELSLVTPQRNRSRPLMLCRVVLPARAPSKSVCDALHAPTQRNERVTRARKRLRRS